MEDAFNFYKGKPWVRSYDEGVPAELDIRAFPLYEMLDKHAREDAGHNALIFMGRRMTYGELGELSDRFAGGLRSLGVKRGDIIALFLPNSPQFAIAYFGALKLGAVVTPMNPLYTQREVEHQIRDSGAKVIVALDQFHDKIKNADAEIIVTSIADYLPKHLAIAYSLANRRPKIEAHKFRDLVKAEPLAERPAINPEEDLAVIMYTGGTTGIPKGAEITHANIAANLQQLSAIIQNVERKFNVERGVWVGVIPWFHIYGMITVFLDAVYEGGTIIAMPRFNPKETMEAIEKYKATLFHGVPTLYIALLNSPHASKYDMSSLIACISGAAPLPREVAERFEKLTGARLREGYGMTETAVVTHVNPILGKHKVGSIGVPIPNTIAAIADPDKPQLLPPGETGELVISGPQVMKGYHNMPADNELVFFQCCGHRWLRTGDLAYMDEEGFFFIVDRKKDMIKYKGYSVFPREIEEVLYQNPCVKEAAVVGVPDPAAGEIPKAFVVLKDECKGKVSEDDIREYLKDKVAHYKMPRQVEFRDELPKTAVGKVLRRALREESRK
ncbi:AMP-binding protein [Thermocladium modestius]